VSSYPAYRLVAAIVGSGLALSLAACSSGSAAPATSSKPATAATTPAPASSPSASSAEPTPSPSVKVSQAPAISPTAQVAKVVLSKADVAAGYEIKLEAGGNTTKGQVTLDNCGYAFTSESSRIARREVDVNDPKHRYTGLTNEVVAYDSVAHAALALNQWRASMKVCKKNVYWTPRQKDTPPLKDLSFSEGADAALPVKDNVVSSFVFTAKGQPGRYYETVIIQRQGTILDAMVLQGTATPTKGEINALSALAVASGKRLAVTSPSLATA
jgi:hypothetical protein